MVTAENFYILRLSNIADQLGSITDIIDGLCDCTGVPDNQKVGTLIAANRDTRDEIKPLRWLK